MDAKEMIEELAVELAQTQIAQVKKGYQLGQSLFNGAIPRFGEIDSALAFNLINNVAVFDKAQAVAAEMLKTAPESKRTPTEIEKRRKN